MQPRWQVSRPLPQLHLLVGLEPLAATRAFGCEHSMVVLNLREQQFEEEGLLDLFIKFAFNTKCWRSIQSGTKFKHAEALATIMSSNKGSEACFERYTHVIQNIIAVEMIRQVMAHVAGQFLELRLSLTASPASESSTTQLCRSVHK